MWSSVGVPSMTSAVGGSGGQRSSGGHLVPVNSSGQRITTPLHRTMQTQTDYRESEAQTDPYTPDYVVRPGTHPEVLTLALLSYGNKQFEFFNG